MGEGEALQNESLLLPGVSHPGWEPGCCNDVSMKISSPNTSTAASELMTYACDVRSVVASHLAIESQN